MGYYPKILGSLIPAMYADAATEPAKVDLGGLIADPELVGGAFAGAETAERFKHFELAGRRGAHGCQNPAEVPADSSRKGAPTRPPAVPVCEGHAGCGRLGKTPGGERATWQSMS